MRIKHNAAFMYVIFLLAIFMIGLGWVLLSKPLEITYNRAFNDSLVDDQEYQTFFIRSHTVWSYILLPISMVLVFSVILKTLKKKDFEG